jgi:hypothetical protein
MNYKQEVRKVANSSSEENGFNLKPKKMIFRPYYHFDEEHLERVLEIIERFKPQSVEVSDDALKRFSNRDSESE